MAFRRTLRKPLIDGYRSAGSKLMAPEMNFRVTSIIPPNAAKTSFHREYLTSSKAGFLRRFFHRSTTMADFLYLPVGERLRERLRVIDSSIVGDRNRLDAPADPVAGDRLNGLTVNETKKLLRMYQVEKIKSKLREIPMSSVSYPEFVQICVDGGGDEDQGREIAKMLDASGTVIVLGNIVFVRPEQMAKSMEALISQTLHHPNDARRSKLDQLEEAKTEINRKAIAGVRAELYSGLGFFLVQTLGFMRLTFWELSWDVMEPICFFVTSVHFALAYVFFLRTSTEPSFQGYFQQRFRVKQEKLMKTHNFDFESYNQLKKLFRPYDSENVSSYGGESVPDLPLRAL